MAMVGIEGASDEVERRSWLYFELMTAIGRF